MLHDWFHSEYEYDAQAETSFDEIGTFPVPKEARFTVVTAASVLTILQREGGRIHHMEVERSKPPLLLPYVSEDEMQEFVAVDDAMIAVDQAFRLFYIDRDTPDPIPHLSDPLVALSITGTLRKIQADQEQSA